MSEQLLHFFLGDSQLGFAGAEETPEDQPKLLWKVVLRTGTWKLRPGPGGVKLKAPLKVFRDKAPKGHISMADLVAAFDDVAKENVTVPTVHADGTVSDSGFVRKLVIQDVAGEDGSKETQSLLWAGLEITEPDILGKIERKSLVGVSGGILFDYERTEDAKKYGQVLSHVMVTNSPWINGTGGFTDKLPEGVMAADDQLDDSKIGELEFEAANLDDVVPEADPAKKPQPASGTVVWKPEEGYQFARGRVQKALDEWRRTLLNSRIPSDVACDFPYYHVEDVAGDGDARKAMICSGYGGEKEAWIAGFKFTDDAVEIEPFMNWTPAKQEWVAASEQNNPTPAPALPEAQPAPGNLGHGRPTPVSLVGVGLQEAQQARAERLSFGRPRTTTTGASQMKISELLAGSGVELSEEHREAIRRDEEERAQKDARLANLERKDREESVNTYLSELAVKLGYEPPEGKTDPAESLDPAIKRYVRSVMLSDDGGPAIELSEETDGGARTQPIARTATDIIKGFIDALPKSDDGKISLSQQARKLPSDPPPPLESDAKPKTEAEARAKARAFLNDPGVPVPFSVPAVAAGGVK